MQFKWSLQICAICLMFTTILALTQYKVTDEVFMEFKQGEKELGRVTLALFGEVAPKTVQNFKVIISDGIDGKTYAGTKLVRVVKRFLIQGGDIVNNDGTGSVSIYGKTFEDEKFIINHTAPGLLGMANSGPNTNGCQFYITTMAAPWLDGKHIIFGKVLLGHGVVHSIELMKTDVRDRLKTPVIISKCGILSSDVEFYEPAENYELSLWGWIKAGWIPLSWSFLILAFFHYIYHQLDKYQI